MKTLDLFAGAGGWDVAAREFDLDPLGIELDEAACETRGAAGFRTLKGDVAALDPADFPCDLLIASPPCQAFSRAGKRAGLADLPKIYAAAQDLALGSERVDEIEWADPRSELVLEPLRWALAIEPQFLAWEQVQDVLPFWEVCADLLRDRGYAVWTGILSAERYGVPQTRERAILLARRGGGQIGPPPATHQRYVKPKAEREEPQLFEAPAEVDRIVLPEDRGLLPWISMSEALGWIRGATVQHRRGGDRLEESWSADRPSDTLTSRADRWQVDRPAPTVTAGGTASGGPEVFAKSGRDAIAAATKLRNGNQEKATCRSIDEPSPTIAFGHNAAAIEWIMEKKEDRREGSRNSPRSAEEPAAVIDTRADLSEWVGQRPATTIAADPRVFPPGGHLANDGRDNSKMVGRSEDAVRVTLQEAAALQSFPPDYPFKGTKSKQFEQIGNAVPPLLAKAILSHLLAGAA